MTEKQALQTPQGTGDYAAIVERVIAAGDLSRLTAQERVQYYARICATLGLNPLTRPFEYIVLNGRLVLYATRSATDQLRRLHNVSITLSEPKIVEDVYIVTATAHTPDGRTDTATGAVSIAGLRGEALANAMMKAETKAKRRVTLSLVGLGWLDETEVETIPNATPLAQEPQESPEPPRPGAADWTRNPTERQAFTAWRNERGLTDAECKRLAGAYLGQGPLAFFRDFPGTRLALQEAIETQMAREMASRAAEKGGKDERKA